MKTILYSLAVVVSSFFVVANARAQYGRPPLQDPCHKPGNSAYRDVRMQSFLYYPQSNVYYNPVAERYIFFSRNAWVVSDRLPHHYRLRKEPRFVVYHNGFDVWNDNRLHCAKYRNHSRVAPDVVYNRSYPHEGYNNRDNSYNYPERKGDWR